MIETDKRKAVFALHQEGTQVREIARLLGLSRNTVRAIIRQAGTPPPSHPRADKQPLDQELLRRLRELGIGDSPQARCDRVPDEPGAEMQHDTSVYQVPLAGRRVKLVASLIYLRYSKRRYLRFYRSFDRFKTGRPSSGPPCGWITSPRARPG